MWYGELLVDMDMVRYAYACFRLQVTHRCGCTNKYIHPRGVAGNTTSQASKRIHGVVGVWY
jgi:hypothetical protein